MCKDQVAWLVRNGYIPLCKAVKPSFHRFLNSMKNGFFPYSNRRLLELGSFRFIRSLWVAFRGRHPKVRNPTLIRLHRCPLWGDGLRSVLVSILAAQVRFRVAFASTEIVVSYTSLLEALNCQFLQSLDLAFEALNFIELSFWFCPAVATRFQSISETPMAHWLDGTLGEIKLESLADAKWVTKTAVAQYREVRKEEQIDTEIA